MMPPPIDELRAAHRAGRLPMPLDELPAAALRVLALDEALYGIDRHGDPWPPAIAETRARR